MKFKVGDLVKRVVVLDGMLRPRRIYPNEKGVGLIERSALSYVRVHWLTSNVRSDYHMSELEYLTTRGPE